MNKKSKIRVYSLFCILSFVLVFSLFISLTSGGDVPEENLVRDYDGNLVNASEPYVWKRTENTEILKNPDGTMSRTIGGGITNYDDGSRRFPNFVPINTTLIQNETEMYGVTYDYYRDLNLYEAYFKEKSGTTDPWLRPVMVKRGDYVLTMAPQSLKFTGQTNAHKQQSIAVTDGKTINYQNQFKNIDLKYNYNPTNLKEELIIDSFEDLADIGSPSQDDDLILKFKIRSYNIESDNNTNMKINGERIDFKDSITTETDEEVYFLDENNETIYYFAKPIAYDSGGSQINLNYSLDYNLFGNLVVEFFTPYSWLSDESRVYPVYVDPTIKLQTADTENLEDSFVDVIDPSYDYGDYDYLLVFGESEVPLDETRWGVIMFNISSIQGKSILSSNLSFYLGRNLLDSGDFFDVSAHHLYNSSWNESSINWNNKPTDYNNTAEDTSVINNTSSGWYNFDVLNSLSSEEGNNISYYLITSNSGGDYEGDEVGFYSKEYATDTSKRPYLNITYTSITSINSPSPNQIFTEDEPTTLFNITNSTPFDVCYAEIDSEFNLTLSNLGNYWTLLNTTMIDGDHTVIFKCNESDGGEWHNSESVSFDVDSVNVTVCRDLSVSDRNYTLINDILNSDVANCIYIKNSNISFDGQGHIIDGDDSADNGIYRGDYSVKNTTIKNITLTDWDYSAIRIKETSGGGILNFSDITISSNPDYGIFIEEGIINMENIYISDTTDYSIRITGESSGNIIDSSIEDIEIREIGFECPNIILLNTSSTTELVYDLNCNSLLTRKWYTEIQVNDSNGDPLQTANINITNSSDINVYSGQTDAGGTISRQELIEYVNTGGSVAYATPHNITIDLIGYETNSTDYNLTELQNLDLQITLLSSVATELITPLNNTHSQSPNFVCNSSSDLGLKNVTLYLWNSTGSLNSTNSKDITGILNQSNFTDAFPYSDYYTWNCYSCDTNDNCAFATSNQTIDAGNLTRCRTLDENDETYYLANDISTTSTCFNITLNDTIIDLNGFKISNDRSSGQYGFNLDNKENITIKNGEINGFASGIYMEYSDDHLFYNLTITNNSDYGIYAENSDNINMTNGNYTDNDDNSIYIVTSCTGWSVNNITYPKGDEFVGGTSELTRNWFYQVYVNDTDSNDVNNSLVYFYDNDSSLIFSDTTDSSGLTSTHLVTEYISTAGVITDYNLFMAYALNYSAPPYVQENQTSQVNFTISNSHIDTLTLIYDTTEPTYEVGTGTESNFTNFSRSFIFFNLSITEDNYENITFYLYNDTLVNSTTQSGTDINWTGLADGEYFYNATIDDLAGNSNSTDTYWITLDTTPPTIQITRPQDSNSYADNDTILLNFTVADALIGLDVCWYNVFNSTPSEIISNTTIVDCLNTTFGLPGGDEDYNLTFFVNDTLGNENSQVVKFSISTDSPAINLDYPTNGLYLTSGENIYMNFTATDQDGLKNCTLYGDFNGTWLANYTWVDPPNATQNFTILNLSESLYTWNVWCNDSLNNYGFANSNYTFTVDETYPQINISSPTSGSSFTGASLTIAYNVSDTNIDSCYFTLKDSDGLTHNYAENTSLACSGTKSISVLAYGTYTFQLWGEDKADQINSSSVTFTMNQPGGSAPPSGGGGGTTSYTTVIILEQHPNTLEQNELKRAILYSRILEFCGGGTCNLDEEQLIKLREELRESNVIVTFNELNLWIDYFEKQKIEEYSIRTSLATQYVLSTSRIIIEEAEFQVIPQIMSGDTGFVCAEEGGEVQQYKRPITANKLFESCEVTQGNWRCEISNDSTTAFITYDFKEPNFFIQTLTGEVKYVSQGGEVDRTRVISLNIVNYCAKIGETGIKITYIVILGVIGVGGFFIYKKRKFIKQKYLKIFRRKRR